MNSRIKICCELEQNIYLNSDEAEVTHRNSFDCKSISLMKRTNSIPEMKCPVDLQSIFNRYRDLCYGFFIKIHGDRELAKDLTQDIFVRLIQSKNDLNQIRNWDKYIYLMCRNRAYDHFKKMGHEKKYKSYLSNYWEQPSNTVRSDTEVKIDAEHYDQILEQSLKQLPAQQKLIFNLSKREGLSHDKIAEKLNLSPITVRNHLHRAIKNIRASINVNIDLIILVLAFSQWCLLNNQ